MDDRGRAHLIDNIAGHLKQCTDREIVRRSIAIFAKVDADFGRRLADKLNMDVPTQVYLFIVLNKALNIILLFILGINST